MTILPRDQHVLRYGHASIDCRVVLECSPRLFGGGSYRGWIRVDGNVLLLYRLLGRGRGAERVDDEQQAGLLLML